MNMPWIRRTAITLGALLLVLVVAAGVLIATFDADRHKALAIDWMHTAHQRTLVIDGPVGLSVFPRLALQVSRLTLSERGHAAEFAAIDEATIAVQLLPLLRRQVVVDRVDARGVRAQVTRDAQGRRNIDDLLGGKAGPPRREAPAAGEAPLRWAISAVQIDDLRLRLHDETTALAGDVLLQSLVSGPLAWDGNTLRAGPLQVALVSASFGTVALAPSTLAVQQVRFSPGGPRLEFDTLKLVLGGQLGGRRFETTLDWPRLQVDAQHLDGSALSGRIRLDGATALAGEFRSAAPSGSVDVVRLPGLALTLAGQLGPRQVDAQLRTDGVLDTRRSALAFEHLDLRASLAGPASPPLDLRLQGSGRASASGAEAQLKGTLNTQPFRLDLAATFGSQRPRLQAAAQVDSLDLDAWFPPVQPTTPARPPGKPADTPLPLDGLTLLDGQFKLDVGALVFRQVHVADAQVTATLEEGSLHVTRLAGGAWGGRVEASGSADAHSRRVALRLTARGVDVHALLQNLTGKDLLEGRGEVTADLLSSGATLGELRSKLAGSAAVQLHDGAIKGVNLARALRQAKAALSLKQDALVQGSTVEKTDFSEMHASARIAGGVAHSDDLDLKSPFLRLGGAGQLDIGRGHIDYTARATVTDTAVGQGGAEGAALRGITVPVHLSGPFDAIGWKIQWSAVASAAIRNKLEDRLGEALGARLGVPPGPAASASAPKKPEDLLKDRLKRLLK